MKRLFLIGMLLLSCLLIGQKPYSGLASELDFGLTKVQDFTSVEPFNTNFGVRYMANTKFGARLGIGFTRIYEDWDIKDVALDDINYMTGTLQGVVNVGRVLNFEEFTPWYTILFGLGGTYIHYGSDPGVPNDIIQRKSTWHVSAQINNEFRLSRVMFVNAKLEYIDAVNNKTMFPSSETTNIFNFNLGITLNLDKDREHADWYVEPPKQIDSPQVVNNYYPVKVVEKKCECVTIENVFFDHDSDVVNRDGLNAIVKTSDKMKAGHKIYIKSYASPPASNDYNLLLAGRRSQSVVDKLLSLGISEDVIVVENVGEVDSVDGKNHDLLRVVRITVK